MSAFWWAVLAAFVWGLVPAIEKMGLRNVEPMVGIFYRCVGVILGLVILTVFIIKPAQIRSVDARSAILLVTAGFLASFIATIAFYHGLKLGEVSLVVPVAGSFFLVAFFLGIFFFGETITFLKIFAVLLITAGLWILKGAAG